MTRADFRRIWREVRQDDAARFLPGLGVASPAGCIPWQVAGMQRALWFARLDEAAADRRAGRRTDARRALDGLRADRRGAFAPVSGFAELAP